MLSSHHATNLQRSGLATLRFLELPCNQQKERDPGYRAVVQPSGNKPAIHTPNSPPCKRTPQIQPTCCNLSLMQRTKSLDHPPAALTQPWKKKKLQQVKKEGFCLPIPKPPSFLPPLLFPACFLLQLAAPRAPLHVSAIGSHCARRLRWWCASKKDKRTKASKKERKSGQNDRPTE